ncbi:MAG: DNA methyltransferase [Syntrophales bacterium]|nr:DNA methyltransferase [Syntrophales bacterium]MDD5640013.1 DNA methyltransferase [Syntrophales bacterium]
MATADDCFTISFTDHFIEAVHSQEPVTGYTHSFYRYPARFSPLFARAIIKAFSQPGDLVFDPFMGGGTSIVEARALGRVVVGSDINKLSVFISKVKTTVFQKSELTQVRLWAESIIDRIKLNNPPVRAVDWQERGYQRNISGKVTWPIRKTIELALNHVPELPAKRLQNLARCALLRTSQWALDCRKDIPAAHQFRQQFLFYTDEIITGAWEFANAVRESDRIHKLTGSRRALCLHRSAAGIETDQRVKGYPAPALILTSPPYPGVHVLYHRWQVQGRRETPAPYWIANSLDGNGASFYTFGHREQKDLTGYFEKAFAAFSSLSKIADRETILVQLVGFSDPSWQLPKFLSVLKMAGFIELKFASLANSLDGRLWRCIPNRKWYADQRGDIPPSKEVVLFHRLS